MICPQCHGPTQKVAVEKSTLFKGIDVRYIAGLHRCAACGLELADADEAATMQERLADGYRRAVGLLSGEEIRGLRLRKGLSQQALADELQIGIASIKRWETGVVQSRAMDNLLRTLLDDHQCNIHTGNREFSIPRIRLVLDAFARHLKRILLRKNDRMLYAAKYLWYADMTACRDLGRSMTGATYAALPMGPQLNNYKELIEEIIQADPHSAPPLTPAEEEIIATIAKTFSTNKMVYDASHRETIWRDCPVGAIIPYSLASELMEMPETTAVVGSRTTHL